MIKLLFLIPEMILKSVAILFKVLAKNFKVTFSVLLIVLLAGGYYFYTSQSHLRSQLTAAESSDKTSRDKLASISAQLTSLENEDQVKKNLDLEKEIANIHDNYQLAEKGYENLVDLKTSNNIGKAAPKDLSDLDVLFAKSLDQLSNKDYSGASSSLTTLNTNIQAVLTKITPTPPPAPVQAPTAAGPAVQTNSPPDSGYQRISVSTPNGNFTVDIVSADLGSTKVIADTASDSDCGNNCPVMPLANYASRSGAFAAIAGPYFCPAAYPSCAGKTNSFDTLMMNKNKHYFNSDNNVYSDVPAAIFSAGSARFVGASKEWGRDTGPDSVIANYPLLIAGGNNVYGGSSDGKLTSKGPRGFIATKGSKVYIGYVLGANTADEAVVMKSLGMDQALNLDEGGSTALWVGGKYVDGPGRDLPFGVLFVRR